MKDLLRTPLQSLDFPERWRFALARAASMAIVLAVVLPALNFAFGKPGFPWMAVLGVPAVMLLIEAIAFVVWQRERRGT